MSQPNTIESLYDLYCNTVSDIYQHLPTLKRLAGQSETIIEFGCRTGRSTVALLAANPKSLISVDLYPTQESEAIEAMAKAENKHFQFVKADTRTIEIDYVDMLFIDTLHTAKQLIVELTHAPKVKKFIVLHDTETFGLVGEQGGGGLKPVLFDLLAQKRWDILRHDKNNNGLTILARRTI